ncbi:hypothetical protein BDQ17DRAFT_1361780 [Cyathus striatus]|nr:hypothetical protein BDQ17DRAFT_1361780 [Cyathus striatus]
MSTPRTFDEIDETELLVSTDNAQAYLFQWLSSTEKKISEIDIANLKAAQQTLEKTLLKIISHPEGYPLPGRAIRELVGRCLVSMYSRGETKSMFNVVQSCMRIVGDFKSLSERDASKIAAFSCIGDIMASFGSQVMSFTAEICTTTLQTPNSQILFFPPPPPLSSPNNPPQVSNNSKKGHTRLPSERYPETNEKSVNG